MNTFTVALITVLLASASACGKSDSSSGGGNPATAASPTTTAPSAAPAVAHDPAAQAREVFKTQCAVCHGERGSGDGAAAATLDPKPRNYTDKAWQASVDDARIKKIILEGGAANGLAPTMAPYATVFKDDPATLDELVKLIRQFGA